MSTTRGATRRAHQPRAAQARSRPWTRSRRSRRRSPSGHLRSLRQHQQLPRLRRTRCLPDGAE
eukprot:5610701-Alexandrium_andersonii.AAC.1